VGGSAAVYQAVHRNGSEVALKVLHPELAAVEQTRRRFLAEARAANLVRHDGVVVVRDDGEDSDGSMFLVMDLLSGETLSSRLVREGPLPVRDVIEWGIAILDILAAAHERRVVHRDVKPSNIFLTDRGVVKLLDFGVARILDDAGALPTAAGVALGTPAFMSPEQAAGASEEVAPATDVWGCGATLFQLLTGRAVHSTEPGGAQITSAATMAAPPVGAFCLNLPAAVGRVIDRSLSFRVADRWPSATSMRQALLQARDAIDLAQAESHDFTTLSEEGVAVLGSPNKSGLLRMPALIGLGFVLAVCALLVASLFPVPAKTSDVSQLRSEEPPNPIFAAPRIADAKTVELSAAVPPSAPAPVSAQQKPPVAVAPRDATPRRLRVDTSLAELPVAPPAPPMAEPATNVDVLDKRK